MSERNPVDIEYIRELMRSDSSLYVSVEQQREANGPIIGKVYKIIERKDGLLIVDSLSDLIAATVGKACCGLTPTNLRDEEYQFQIAGFNDRRSDFFLFG